jgi:hypothetical protein
MVRVIVADNGPGMEPAVRERCSEPFFTTKPRGLGTGMGLALVHGVVVNAGGTIEVHSQPGNGSTFVLTLPAAPAPRADDTPDAPPRRAIVKVSEPRMRALAAHTLTSLNFHLQDDPDAGADLLVVGGFPLDVETAFLERNPRGHVLRIGNGVVREPASTADPRPSRVTEIGPNAKPAQLREIIQSFALQSGDQP